MGGCDKVLIHKIQDTQVFQHSKYCHTINEKTLANPTTLTTLFVSHPNLAIASRRMKTPVPRGGILQDS